MLYISYTTSHLSISMTMNFVVNGLVGCYICFEVANETTMGCTSSVCAFVKINNNSKKKNIPQVSVFFPCLRIPVQSDMHRALRGLNPKDLAQRITSIRNQIVLVAEDTGGSAISELQKALKEYTSLLIGLTNEEHMLHELVEFRWKDLESGRKEICVANPWFELLSVIHMMAMLTLTEANLNLIPKDNNNSLAEAERNVSSDCMREGIDLLLKAAGYLNFCVKDVILRIPPDIKNKMPADMQENVLEALVHQALAQGTEIQLGLAVQTQNATLSVKRRLACEQLSFLGQAHFCLSRGNNINNGNSKQFLFLKWKYIEAKAAAYYYHGLILDKGTHPSSHVTAVCCLLAAEEMLAESKKACLTFCLARPITRAPPPWGAMKHLHKKIPETALKKSQMYGYLMDQDKSVQNLPDLPEFQLSLKPDDYELPEMDPAWVCGKWDVPEQTLKEHLRDGDD